jgi:hypothetical protein
MSKTISHKSLTMILDLPALTGSEKQVAWAEQIRTTALESILREITECKDLSAQYAADPAAFAKFVSDTLSKSVKAAKWIEYRSHTGFGVIELAQMKML